MNIFEKRHERLRLFHNFDTHHQRKTIPEHVFETCPHCHSSIPYRDLIANQYVCPACTYHLKISARERIRQLCDFDSFKEMDKHLTTKNVDDFSGYDQKLDKARASCGMYEAVICGIAKMEGIPLAIGVMDSHFMMGSMGVVVGEKITRLIAMAQRKHLPLLIFCASGGARMQEGMQSLVQMAKTSSQLKQFDGLYISILTHPTTGGVLASFAMLGDIILAEPHALVGFAGRRVIEDTIKEKLPDDFQQAEFVLQHGFIDDIVDRRVMKKYLVSLLQLHGGKADAHA